MKIVTADFLERTRAPGSRFQSDYLAYERGEITRRELIARLPHVAMIGDSVCTSIYVSTRWPTLWRARSCRDRNWFLNVDPGTPIESISRRLEKITPIVATHHGGIGAMIDSDGQRLWWTRRIVGTQNLSGQINRVASAKRFPNLVLIAIGHNNVDWAWRSSAAELQNPGSRLQRQRDAFIELFARRLQPLIEHAHHQEHRVAIIVFGVVNFESYFRGRAEAEQLRATNSRLYPHLETTYRYLTSFRPAYRQNVIRLSAMVNRDLREMIDKFNRELIGAGNVQLRYSDALATADLSRAELLHPVDAWHPSIKGHNVLAEAAFGDLIPSLKFLGIL